MTKQWKWSWLGFFCGPFYYIGYGKLKKGWILFVFYCLSSLLVGIYCGVQAKKELPVGEVEFNWKQALVALAIYLVYLSLSIYYSEQLKTSLTEVPLIEVK